MYLPQDDNKDDEGTDPEEEESELRVTVDPIPHLLQYPILKVNRDRIIHFAER